ncbi:MAG: hypothetical protein GC162_13620 [Planctomycetes bacterium]|nr:hypothetical protein [Planctomycetota bacterium]
MMHNRMIITAIFAAALWSGGCARTQMDQTLKTDYSTKDTTASLDFWHDLADAAVTTNDEALHGLILLAHEDDPNKTYEERVDWLKKNGYLGGDFDRPGKEAATRGTVAQVLVKILKVDGGLTMRVIGDHPRYATRELVYMEIFPPCSEQQGMSGIQFVGAISRAEAYLEEQS